MAQPTHHIFVVSDGSGETAINMVRAMLTQFSSHPGVYIRRYSQVKDRKAIEKVLYSAAQVDVPVMVGYTIVNTELNQFLSEGLRRIQGCYALDLFSQPMAKLAAFLDASPEENPDRFHGVDDTYFKRMEAIEFTLRHDDGQLMTGLEEADIVLVGVSRAGKTPLSLYLSLYGYKVVNIPLAKGVKPPDELEHIKQRKIVGLTIDPSHLLEIRKKRITGLNAGSSEYSDPQAIMEELEEAARFFRKHRHWPLINVTNRSIEETASLVRDKVYGRDRNAFNG